MQKFVWGDERFEQFRETKLDTIFGVIKMNFESFWEQRGLRDAKAGAWKGIAEGKEVK